MLRPRHEYCVRHGLFGEQLQHGVHRGGARLIVGFALIQSLYCNAVVVVAMGLGDRQHSGIALQCLPMFCSGSRSIR